MKFGSLVRQRREDARIALNDLARKIGISPAYWSRIERNIEKPPKDELILAAARELGIFSDDAFVSAGRLPPDLRDANIIAEMVAMCRKMNTHPKNERSEIIFCEDKTVTICVSGNLIRMEIERNEHPKLTYQFAADVCPLPNKNP